MKEPLDRKVLAKLTPAITHGLKIVSTEINTIANRHVPRWTGTMERSMGVEEKGKYKFWAYTSGEEINPKTGRPVKDYLFKQYFSNLNHKQGSSGYEDLTAGYRGDADTRAEGEPGLNKYRKAYQQAKRDGILTKSAARWYKKVLDDPAAISRLKEIFAGVFR